MFLLIILHFYLSFRDVVENFSISAVLERFEIKVDSHDRMA